VTSIEASEALERLKQLWLLEQRAVQEQFTQARKDRTLQERVRAGIALRDLEVQEILAAPGDYTRAWLAPRKDNLEGFDLRSGSPLVVWRDEIGGEYSSVATLWRVERDRVGIYVEGDLPDWMETPGFNLDEEAPDATFQRGVKAIDQFLEAKNHLDEATIREALFGIPEAADRPSKFTPFDPLINPAQLVAVQQALDAPVLALIHGPPGTGKTRTLIEVIRQAVERKESVLATAASNQAVDNLVERLDAAGVEVVRIGHPARVSEAAMARSLDGLLEQNELYGLAKKWMDEANANRRRIQIRADRGQINKRERREQLSEVWALMKDARQQIKRAQQTILERADVICATAAGSASSILGKKRFDLVVLDEATQATDPIALVPLTRARRVVMAGDPCQLPPTVISRAAENQGLGETFFERLVARGASVTMLVEQHRMNETIMRFPSDKTYAGELIAHASVASHTLEDLGVAPDEVRAGPLVFIDTAGKGWEDEREEETESTRNRGQAELTVSEVKGLIARGVSPSDIGVITPYKAQVRLLEQALVEEREAGLEIASIDGFQGREKEAIVVDLVRSNAMMEIGFLQDTRRMNVALTRARRFLLVIGDSATISAHPYYADFLDAVQEHGVWLSAWTI
jgi:superfamily I DNA and/or RNA helicase